MVCLCIVNPIESSNNLFLYVSQPIGPPCHTLFSITKRNFQSYFTTKRRSTIQHFSTDLEPIISHLETNFHKLVIIYTFLLFPYQFSHTKFVYHTKFIQTSFLSNCIRLANKRGSITRTNLKVTCYADIGLETLSKRRRE